MPEGSVDEDRNAPPWPGEIGRTGDGPVMAPPAPNASCVQCPAKLDLGGCVDGSDRRHDATAVIRGPGVRHACHHRVRVHMVPSLRRSGSCGLPTPNGVGMSLSPVTRRPLAVDLFSGVGGFSLGLEQAGFDVVAAVEWDAIHAVSYAFNFPLTRVLCADICDVTPSLLRDVATEGAKSHGPENEWDGEIDVVFGGPPCQGFSAGGKRRPADSRNRLVFEFLRLALSLRPRYVVLENVPPLRLFPDSEVPGGILLDRLASSFTAGGYTLLPPIVVNASWYGVPQDRRRLLLIGARGDQVPAGYPLATSQPVAKSISRDPGVPSAAVSPSHRSLTSGPTVWDAIGDLPNLDSFDGLLSADETALGTRDTRRIDQTCASYARTLRLVESDPTDFGYPRLWNRALLTASMRTRHSPAAIRRFAKTPQGAWEPTSRFYRLDASGLCSTLRAGTGYERGSFMAPRPIHPFHDRVISVREAARLHSFPDWFRFHSTKWHGFRQVGNALPPLLARAIGERIAAALDYLPARPGAAVGLGDPSVLKLATKGAASHIGADLKTIPSHRMRLRPDRPQARQAAVSSLP